MLWAHRSPPILLLSLSDYISVATQPQESLSIVRVDSNFSCDEAFVGVGRRRAYPLCSDPAVWPTDEEKISPCTSTGIEPETRR